MNVLIERLTMIVLSCSLRLAQRFVAGLLLWGAASAAVAAPLPEAEGYRGIWYMNQPTGDEHAYKYSGGMATYPQQHVPIAVFSEEANKTFFVYGGTNNAGKTLLHMVSYYDHATGKVPRPRILLDKKTDDAHDNPTLQLDDAGHLWIFSAAHGTSRPSYIHRSVLPYSIDEFELIEETNFSYPQPWHLRDAGFLFLHTRYASGRGLFSMGSRDGKSWEEPRPLAKIDMGDYQISWADGSKVGTAFDYHPSPLGLNARTNIYYIETRDRGTTWQTAQGETVETPLTDPRNRALVRDYRSEGLLVYLKDIQFDTAGRPVILFLTSRGYEPGPKSGPRMWHTARWTGSEWQIRPVTTSDHNYDHGSLYLVGENDWRIIAPTDPGPQPFGTGGEMVLWVSRDQGESWTREKQLTTNSPRNHTYARRPVNARPDFSAFWADGNPLEPSESRLYFTDREGRAVRQLPAEMASELAEPERIDSKAPSGSRE